MSITLVTHKVAAAAVGVAMVFSFAFVTPANAQTVEELTAQINSLLATIASLQSQLAGMTGGTTGGTTGGMTYNFTMNHELGDQGGQVMDIQKFLNAQGFTVSASGAGSPGNETSYFGSRTQQAVVAFQNANAAAILAPVGLTSGTGYWGPSSRAYANTMSGGTGTGTGTGTTVPTGTGITVAAAAQPANALAVANAARVPFTKFTLTNNSGSTQTVNSVTVKRTGLAANTSFSGVVLLDQNGVQLGNERVINSNDEATIGNTITLQPGMSHTFTVAANMDSDLSQEAGEVASFAVTAVNTSAAVAGSLPITGAAHTINATLSIGSVTGIRGVEDPNAASSEEVGTTNYVFTAIRLTAGSAENVRLHSIRFDQSGSADASDLANVRLTIDGVDYTPMVDGDTYTFTFGSGIVINEGFSKEIALRGDIVGGANRTVAFDIEEYTDIHVTGETFGYGITVTDGGSGFGPTEPVYNAFVVTITPGAFNSVSRSSAAPAANVGIQNQDETLGAFTIDLKGEPINVQTMNFDVTVNAGATDRQITNVKLVDQNGVVIAGPVDSTTTWGTSGTTVANAVTFSSVDLPTGVTTVFVRGQLNTNWVADDTVAFSTQPSTDWSGAKGQNTGDTVTLPSATATANTMTVKTASLTAVTLSQPAARNIVAGASDFVFATVNLDAANSGEDVRVTGFVIEDTASSSAGATDIDNVEIWANLSGGSTNDSVRGDRFETRVADAEQFAGTSGSGDKTLSITLDNHITVAKNSNVEIAIVGDLASGATATDSHTISIDQTSSGSVTAVGLTSGNIVTVDTSLSGAGQTMTVSGGGALTITVDSSSPDGTLVLDDTTNEQTLAVFRLAANNVENLDVDSIQITDDGSTSNGGEPVQKYVFYHGATKLGEVVPSSGTAELFMSDGVLTVPADGHVLVTVKGVMNNIVTNGVLNNDSVRVTIAAGGDVDTTGLDSGTAVDGTGTNYDADAHTIYEAYPTFAFNNDGVSTVLGASANYLAAKVAITNTGNEDITFSNDTSSSSITFQIEVAGDLTASTTAFTLQESDGTTLSTVGVTGLTSTGGSGEAVAVFEDATLTVPAGGTETLDVRINTAGLTTAGNTLQVWLSDDTAGNLIFSIDAGSANYSEGDDVFKGDIFGPTHVNPS